MKYLTRSCFFVALAILSTTVPTVHSTELNILEDASRLIFGDSQQAMEAAVPQNLPPSPLDDLASDDMKVSVITGSFVGALGGLVIAIIEGDEEKILNKTLTGALAGAAAGAVAGSVAERRRAAFESESAYLDAEINSANKAINSRSEEIAEYEESIADTETRVVEIEKRHKRNKDVTEDAREEQKKLNTAVEQNKKVLAKLDASIEYLDETLKEPRQRHATMEEDKAELQELKAQLSDRRKELKDRYDRLHRANQKGEQLSERLSDLIRALKGSDNQ